MQRRQVATSRSRPEQKEKKKRKIFFGPAPYVLSFSKWRKTMEIWKNARLID